MAIPSGGGSEVLKRTSLISTSSPIERRLSYAVLS